jgi:hypothetical protein
MFEGDLFEKWLKKKSDDLIGKLDTDIPLNAQETIILILKAQANHTNEDIKKQFRKIYLVLIWGFGLLIAGLYLPMILNLFQA